MYQEPITRGLAGTHPGTPYPDSEREADPPSDVTAGSDAFVSISRMGGSNLIRLEILIGDETTQLEMTPESFALAVTGATESPAKYTLRRIKGKGRVHPNVPSVAQSHDQRS